MIMPTEEQQNPNVSTRVIYFIRGMVQEKDKYGNFVSCREFVNKYATQDEVMERFAYWSNQPETLSLQVILTVATSEIVAEWRRGEPDGVSRDESSNDVDSTASADGDSVPQHADSVSSGEDLA